MPYSLIKGPTFIKFWKILKKKINKRMTAMPRLMQKSIKILMPYVYSRPYVYSFWQIFQALRLFPALRLFRTLEYVNFTLPKSKQ